MADRQPLLSDELLRKVQDTARDQKRQPAQVITDAVQKYLEEQDWLKFVQRNDKRAHANGIAEEDVDRLISEVRREKAERGH